MVLEAIIIVRHGFRSNWIVDSATGTYHSNVPSPTGITADPALAGYGVIQAEELGKRLADEHPPVDLIYSSPFYRCIQTLVPFTSALATRTDGKAPVVNLEPGVGEFFGAARFDHPSPASLEVLQRHFDHLRGPESGPIVVPSIRGETITQLHNRVAYCLQRLIERADSDPSGPRTLLICTHAAVMICMGRVLTGRMPADESEDDFQCYTCSLSKFVRRSASDHRDSADSASGRNPENMEHITTADWKGRGVGGGWECKLNADCSFLSGGQERGWRFSGDESFLSDPNAFNDTINKSRTSDSNTQVKDLAPKNSRKSSDSHL